MTTTADRCDAAFPPGHGRDNNNPPGISFLSLLKEDFRVHDSSWRDLGFWAIGAHRFGNWRMGIRSRPLRAPFSVLYNLLYTFVEVTTGVTLPYTVPVGRRVRIWHHSGIILHARSIGDETQIRQNTTMGIVAASRPGQIPTIGARVDIGCGACLLGDIRIGDDARIGANAVVLCDVPAGATAVGIPARVIRRAEKGPA